MTHANIRALPDPSNPHAADVAAVLRWALEVTEAHPHKGILVFLVDKDGNPSLEFYGANSTELAGALFRAAMAVGEMESAS